MTKKEEKNVISFESEGEVHEEAQALLHEVESYINDEMPEYRFLTGFRKTADLEGVIYANNLKLMEKAQDMNKIIITNAQKVKTIFQLASNDNSSLTKLKNEYDEAMKVISSSYLAEKDAKKKIAELRDQVSSLADSVQNGAVFAYGTEESVFETANEVENLKREFAKAVSTRQELEKEIEERKATLEKVESAVSKLQKEEGKLSRAVNTASTQLTDLTEHNEETTKDIMEISPQIKESRKKISENITAKTSSETQFTQLKQSYYDVLSTLNGIKDELKQRKDKMAKRVKVQNEWIRKSGLMNEEKDDKNKKLKSLNEEKENLLAKLETVNSEGVEFEQQLDEKIEFSKEIQEKKSEVRKVAKEMRQIILDTNFKLATGESTKHSTQRQTSEMKGAIQKNKLKEIEEIAETAEEKNKSKTIRSETIAEKSTLQGMKEKILMLFKEIDQKRTEHFQINSRILVTQDFIKSTNEQFKQHTAEYETYKTKIKDQSDLSDKIRNERNNYKRMHEIIEQENSDLTAQIGQLTILIKESNDKISKTSNDIFNDHVGNIRTKKETQNLIDEKEEETKLILQAERIISRLNAERQTLSYILHEAENDQKEQNNEFNNAKKNFEIEREEGIKRERKIAELHSEIKTILNFIDRSKEMYNEKVEEILKSHKEIEVLNTKTKQLERKKELVRQLQFREHKISTELMLEKHRSMTLIHEFAVPRNVHRWDALEAVDPGYVKNIKYRMSLYIKLDEAHRELLDLQKEKSDILKSLGISNEKISKSLTKQQCQLYIEKYKNDIERMNQEIKEMKESAHERHPYLNKSTTSLEKVRNRINQRKSSASALHTKINSIHMENGTDFYMPSFMTESDTYVPTLGGGFVHKILSPTVKRTIKSDLAIYGQSRPQTVSKISPLISPQQSKTRKKPLPPLNKL